MDAPPDPGFRYDGPMRTSVFIAAVGVWALTATTAVAQGEPMRAPLADRPLNTGDLAPPADDVEAVIAALDPLLSTSIHSLSRATPDEARGWVHQAKLEFEQRLNSRPEVLARLRWWLCGKLLESAPELGLEELAALENGPFHPSMLPIRLRGLNLHARARNIAAVNALAEPILNDATLPVSMRAQAAASLLAIAPDADVGLREFHQTLDRLAQNSANGALELASLRAGTARTAEELAAAMNDIKSASSQSNDHRVRALFPLVIVRTIQAGRLQSQYAGEALEQLKFDLQSDPAEHIADLLLIGVALQPGEPALGLDAFTEAERYAAAHFAAHSEEVRIARTFRGKSLKKMSASDEDQAAYADLDLTQMYTVHCGYTIGKHKAGDVLITTSVRRETP